MSEKFYLQWNDFPMNTADTFAKLRNNETFKDVTIFSEDQQKITAHRVVLSSCSSYFDNILSNNQHSHPLLCLDGIRFEELKSVIDYMYFGEVKINQENLQKFLKAGKKLQLAGLMDADVEDQNECEQSDDESIGEAHEESLLEQQNDKWKTDTDIKKDTVITITPDIQENSLQKKNKKSSKKETIIDEDLNESLNAMVTKTNDGFKCIQCDKLYNSKAHAKRHCETHFEGLNYKCHLCDKQYKTSNSLNVHVYLHSKNKNKLVDNDSRICF